VFKYWNFGVENARLAWSAFSGQALDAPSKALEVLLPPVGISFFTFVALGYVIDVYRRQLEPHTSYLRFVLFVSFFPHLVAGPIVRARDLLPQLAAPPLLSREDGGEALFLVAAGLLKKVVLADQLGMQLCDRVFDSPHAFSALEVLAAVYGYALQIYCDFSGYSDIAVGSALLLGVRFPVNFDAPYKATSPVEFWRRWHISLSTWLRDYLYIPLGGNRRGRARRYLNLLVTMLLGGLWHGAAWTFVLWGLLHGLGLAATHVVRAMGAQLRPRTAPTDRALGASHQVGASRAGPDGSAVAHAPAGPRALGSGRRLWRGLGKLAGWMLTFHFVCVGWIFFRSPSVQGAAAVFRRLGSMTTDHANLPPVVLGLLALGLVSHLAPQRLYLTARTRFIALPAVAQGLVLFLVAVVLHEAASTAAVPFVYFQF
jgi:D-alanyl-lipoteichoic acid acyltransferase DltB (MBOAT superfamily)